MHGCQQPIPSLDKAHPVDNTLKTIDGIDEFRYNPYM